MGSGCAKHGGVNTAPPQQSDLNEEEETKEESASNQDIRSNNNITLEVVLDSDAQNRYSE